MSGWLRVVAAVLVLAGLLWTVSSLRGRGREACWGLPRLDQGGGLALEPVFPSLDLGLLVQLVPDPTSGWYAVRLDGVVSKIEDDRIIGTFLDISDRVSVGVEWGLQSMALHPAFETNGEVYISYTSQRPGHDAPRGFTLVSVVSRFRSADGGRTIDPGSEVVLMRDYSMRKPPWHPIAQLGFGPDGNLYVGWGESLKGGQDPQSFAGKMLRVDVTPAAGAPYRIPEDNPFARGGGARPEIFALGLRNPWRWSFDRQSGKLWLGDVGSEFREEVNVVEAGKNYGWPLREGRVCLWKGKPDRCRPGDFIDPVVEVPRAESCAVVGGYVYRGRALPDLAGVYLYADFCSGSIWGLAENTPRLLASAGKRVVAFAEDREGEIYVSGYASDHGKINGFVSRLVRGAAPSKSMPQRLSDTGCVASDDPTRPAPGLVAYEVNAPAWSSGARAGRWFALPPYARIRVAERASDWVVPRGATIMQNLEVDGRLVETRLLVRHADGDWSAYGYEWDAAETEATLVTQGKSRKLGGDRDWVYPSPQECLQCHTAAANRALALNTPQMSRQVVDPATGQSVSQIAAFVERKWLGTLFPEQSAVTVHDPANPRARLARLDDEGETVERRARAYLHVNCAHCHRPGGVVAKMDLRFDVPEDDMAVCDVAPVHGDLAIRDARLVAPGDPTRSILARRLHATEGGGMPPVGVSLVDTEGASLIDAWIRDDACRQDPPT